MDWKVHALYVVVMLVIAGALFQVCQGPAHASGGGVPPERWLYIQPYSWCPDANGEFLEYPVLYAFNKKHLLGPVAPASCARIDGYTARSAMHLRCEHSGVWSPVHIVGTATDKTTFMPTCLAHSGTAQDFR